MSTTEALRCEGVSAGYGRVPVLSDVTFSIQTGEIVAVVGRNGAGKTSLLRTISGLLKIYGGSVSYQGEDITGLRPHEVVRKGLLHVQEGRRIFQRQSVESNLELGRFGVALSEAERSSRLEYVYSMFPILADRASQRAALLSGGQQQMLAIAQALMRSPRVLMLDEPSLGLAPSLVREVLDALPHLRERGVTIVLVEQAIEEALRLADRVLVMKNGQLVVAADPGSDVLDKALNDAYFGSVQDSSAS